MSNDLFAVATRKKFRFPFNGQISVEDLWDLKPAQLDKVYKALKLAQKASNEESLMVTRSAADTETDMMIEIVKFIYDVKNEEKLAAAAKIERDAQNAHIREIIADKKDEALKNMSIEDLQKLIDE